ncbi:MAG: hypothetical protein LKM39_17460 [Chiayiivirga sp.]|nr:hypothetical protein [Chiayiivirga sp.]
MDAGSTKTTTVPASLLQGGKLALLATDAIGNSSAMAISATVFADGFESGRVRAGGRARRHPRHSHRGAMKSLHPHEAIDSDERCWQSASHVRRREAARGINPIETG